MEEQELQEIARQLRKPDGDFGMQIGNLMNDANLLMNQFAIETVNPSKGDKILEIGMGNGLFVKDILSKEPSVNYTGLDFSDVMITEARKINSEWINKKRASFTQADASNMPFDDDSFNKIFTVNTLYFWEDPDATLKEIARVLQPDGYFFQVFRPKTSMEQFPFTKYGFKMYQMDEVKELFEKNNFTINDTFIKKEPMQPGDEEVGIKEYEGEVIILKTNK